MEFNNRKSVHDELRKYCILAKKDDFIEVCEWTNGEGWDVTLNDKIISLTYGELDAINYLTRTLAHKDREI